jgi:sugar lactone lactonase YvrE
LNSLYISDFGNNRVQKYLINASFGITVAGQANGTGCSSSMCLSGPAAVAVDTNGNVYVADTVNNRVQFWSAGSLSGITVAGNSKKK